jgi:hypothetical protein
VRSVGTEEKAMRNPRSDVERNVVALPPDEARAAVRRDEEPLVIDLTLLPAAPQPVPVRHMQHWLDLCG